MYCKNCGNLLTENEKYCAKCGEMTSEKSFNTAPAEGKNKWKKYFYILGIVCVVLFSLLVGVIVGVTGKDGITTVNKSEEDDNTETNDVIDKNIKDTPQVKTVEHQSENHSYKVEFDTNGLPVSYTEENVKLEIKYENDGDITKGYIEDYLIMEVEFDNAGNRIADKTYTLDGRISQERQYSNNKMCDVITYSYDEEGLYFTSIRKYNEYGDEVEITQCPSQENSSMYYVSKQNNEYEYDSKGNKLNGTLVSEYVEGEKGKTIKTTNIEYNYDSAGKLVEERWMSDGFCEREVIYTYDEEERVKEKQETLYESEGEFRFSSTLSYEYDEAGNIKVCKYVCSNESLNYTCYYTYYE